MLVQGNVVGRKTSGSVSNISIPNFDLRNTSGSAGSNAINTIALDVANYSTLSIASITFSERGNYNTDNVFEIKNNDTVIYSANSYDNLSREDVNIDISNYDNIIISGTVTRRTAQSGTPVSCSVTNMVIS